MALKNYNCAVDPGNHSPNNCEKVLGGNDAVAFILDDAVITDPTNPVEWQAGIDAGTIILVEKIRGEYPEASPVKGENIRGCGPTEVLDGFDHVYNVQDANVNDSNDNFWSSMNLLTTCFAWWNCSENTIRFVDNECRVTAIPSTSPASNKEKQLYTVTVDWSSAPDDHPVRYEAPPGIFSS